ncbi:Holliday junction branch migration protein RuvA [bacterium]|nr:Holliday junction branch migration protein RuvA [bacterium]
MIDRIEGEIVHIEPTHAVVDVGGVGFFLSISVHTYEKAGRSKRFRFLTHLHVREDVLQLFGFADEAERAAFRKLISISKVGPKVAQAILSSLTVSTLRDAVAAGDWKRLTAAPGVGRKLAERLVIELRGAFGEDLGTSGDGADATGGGGSYAGTAGAVYETVQALTALGYAQDMAEKLAARAAKQAGADTDVQTLLKIALKP